MASPCDRQEFGAFLKSETVLEALTISGRYDDTEHCLRLVLDALRSHGTLTAVNLNDMTLGEDSADLLQKVAAENKVLQNLRLTNITVIYIVRTLCNRLAASFAENDTLKELVVPLDVCADIHWKLFFEKLFAQGNGKKVIMEVSDSNLNLFLQVNKYVRECDALENVMFHMKTLFGTAVQSMLGARRLSKGRFLSPGESDSPLEEVTNYLSSFILTRISELEFDELLCRSSSFALAHLFEKTSTLKKVTLNLDWHSTEGDRRVIFESLARNTSVTELSVDAPTMGRENTECFPNAVNRSRTIRRGSFRLGEDTPRFLALLARDIEDNYNLNDVELDYCSGNYREFWWRVLDTARRNNGLVVRTFRVLSTGDWDRHSAVALETVSRHPAILAELAEVMSISETDAEARVLDGTRSLEDDMHVFMMVVGVVRERVECHPREDGRTQLDDLNIDCWRHLRRFLSYEDVKLTTSCLCAPSNEKTSGRKRKSDNSFQSDENYDSLERAPLNGFGIQSSPVQVCPPCAAAKTP